MANFRFLTLYNFVKTTTSIMGSKAVSGLVVYKSVHVSRDIPRWRITHSPRNTEDVGSIPGTDRYIVARMTTTKVHIFRLI